MASSEYRIFYYCTQHNSSDGKTTPVVFRDGRLEGWGETLLRRIGAGH